MYVNQVALRCTEAKYIISIGQVQTPHTFLFIRFPGTYDEKQLEHTEGFVDAGFHAGTTKGL